MSKMFAQPIETLQTLVESSAEGICKRDAAALGVLVRKAGAYLRNIILKVLRDEADTDDVFAIVLRVVWKEAHRYRSQKGSFLNFCATIAHRRAIDFLRSVQARRKMHERFKIHEASGGLANSCWPIFPDDEGARIRNLLEHPTISDEQRECLFLHYFMGMSHSEVSVETGAPLGTVKGRLSDGLLKLRKLVADDPVFR